MPGGDGGNRTRVRKNRPSNIYERSRSLFSLACREINRPASGQSLRARKPSFAQLHDVLYGTPAFLRPLDHRQESGAGGRRLTRRLGICLSCIKQRGASSVVVRLALDFLY